MLCGSSRRHDLETRGLCFLTTFAFSREPYYHITPIISHVESVRMALISVADHSYLFSLDKF
jgi:hypothetical protein